MQLTFCLLDLYIAVAAKLAYVYLQPDEPSKHATYSNKKRVTTFAAAQIVKLAKPAVSRRYRRCSKYSNLLNDYSSRNIQYYLIFRPVLEYLAS